MPYEIEIDSDSCTVSGRCVLSLPEVFGVEDDTAVVLDQNAASDDDILAAAQGCPWAAIALFDRETGRCVYP